jgi:hypothetical protein
MKKRALTRFFITTGPTIRSCPDSGASLQNQTPGHFPRLPACSLKTAHLDLSVRSFLYPSYDCSELVINYYSSERPPWLACPPLRPASDAFCRSFAKLPGLFSLPCDWPPFDAISRCCSSSIAANPRLLDPPWLLRLLLLFSAIVMCESDKYTKVAISGHCCGCRNWSRDRHDLPYLPSMRFHAACLCPLRRIRASMNRSRDCFGLP